MDTSTQYYESLIRSAAQYLKGHQRRLFQAEVATVLCGGSARLAEHRFGWGRYAVGLGKGTGTGRARFSLYKREKRARPLSLARIAGVMVPSAPAAVAATV